MYWFDVTAAFFLGGGGQEVLVRDTELISHYQLEEFRKGQKETPHVNHLLESFLLASILAEQGVHHQEGL